MNSAYLNRLTPAVQAFVLEIERAAGIEIDVKVDGSRDGRGPDGAGSFAEPHCPAPDNPAVEILGCSMHAAK